jgi:hypothetical protein
MIQIPLGYSAEGLPGNHRLAKTNQSVRKAALPEGLLRNIEVWRMMAVSTQDDAWLFPSERMPPMSKDNCWNRNIKP